MATARIEFPDSGRVLEIERVSFLTLSMLRAHYEKNYEGKPVQPVDPAETYEGDTDSDEFKKLREAYQAARIQYDADSTLWQTRAHQAQRLLS